MADEFEARTRSGAHAGLGGDDVQETAEAAAADDVRLTRRGLSARSIAVLPRMLDPVVAQALDKLAADRMATFRVEGRRSAVLSAAGSEIRRAMNKDSWLADWLASDVAFLTGLYHELTGARSQRVRMQHVTGQLCPKFHTDNNRFRLITTYRGHGTEWVEPENSIVRRIPKGHVAILRGERAATATVPAIVHRSPPGDETSNRLLLVIDEVRSDGDPTARSSMTGRPPE